MSEFITVPPEHAEHWDRLADRSDLEKVPDEIPIVGGFEYLVAPAQQLGTFSFGGYDTLDEDRNLKESLLIVGAETPRETRGFVVAHMILHKAFPDDHTPYQCVSHDGFIQKEIASMEPDLLDRFYEDLHDMYRLGFRAVSANPQAPELALDRYRMAKMNAAQKGELIIAASKLLERLNDSGLVLPDGENIALNAVDKRSGERTMITLQVEAGDKHTCKNCSHGIVKGAQRITTATKKSVNGYSHHHYHPGCFNFVEFGNFGDPHQDEHHLPH